MHEFLADLVYNTVQQLAVHAAIPEHSKFS